MTNESAATEQTAFIYELIARFMHDHTTDMVTPIQDFVNNADNPQVELVVLTAGSIIIAAAAICAISTSEEEAFERITYALLANDINEILTPLAGTRDE